MFEKVVFTITTMMCVTTIATTVTIRQNNSASNNISKSYEMPSFDPEAIEGNPDVDSDFYSTIEIPITSGNCKVSIDASPEINGDMLNVYFTNSEENDVNLKLVIYNENDEIIGESGIVKKGEYVKSIMLNEKAEGGQLLKAKILTYENETFYSLGSAGATLLIR